MSLGKQLLEPFTWGLGAVPVSLHPVVQHSAPACCLLSRSGAEAVVRGGWVCPPMVSELKGFSFLSIPRPKNLL